MLATVRWIDTNPQRAAGGQTGGQGPVRWLWVSSRGNDVEWRCGSRNGGGGECPKEMLKMVESLGLGDVLNGT